ncbi:MAG: serine hydrolase [Planctomycetota bacterium]|nr:serine hydrolase [Planctomycetota bacterium]
MLPYMLRFLAVGFALAIAATTFGAERPLPRVDPSDVGMRADVLAKIGPTVVAAIEQKQLPGCVVLIGRRGQIAYWEAFGDRQIEPHRIPMDRDAVFDLASLTKPIATATSVMILADRGVLNVDEPVARYWPEFAASGKQEITVRHLLIHTSGLIPDNALDDYQHGSEEAWRRIANLAPRAPLGEKFQYSDVGFLVLGKVVERVSGKTLDEFTRDEIFRPLGMNETGYLPGAALRERAAPATQRDGAWIQGEVHDPRAHLLGGVAGHAGLFSTPQDLAVYASALTGRGKSGSEALFSAKTWALMAESNTVPNGIRALGWDRATGYSINRGAKMSAQAFGHGGFTGTALWIDPAHDLFVIFLSNRLHPHGKGSVNRLAGEIGDLAVESLRDE